MDKKELKITLKSDLCVGSGYSYAGIIDSDISYDDCGLPYIPAKRIKGCLREAAELIGFTPEEIEKLFGRGGEAVPYGVFLGNAYIKNYEHIYDELKNINKGLKVYVTPQNILEQFTTTKAQTKIMENGVAKDNSFRFMRVVKQYSPVDNNQELAFYADLDFANLEAQDVENFKMVVKALRHMGLNRNRGLGSVKCMLVVNSESDNQSDSDFKADLSVVDTDEDTYVLSYCVQNTAPLILSGDNDYTTEKYISGQSVLGYFASEYLRSGQGNDDEFEKMFLKNQVIFSGLYPCDEPNEKGVIHHVYYPAPSYINCLKKTKKYVNVSKQIPVSEDDCKNLSLKESFARGNGNQPKKLKGKFVCVDGRKIAVREVKTDIACHHTKKSKKQDAQDGELLYSFETVREHQTFAGTITGKGKYIKILAKLLNQNRLRFGKSRSSQYGTCILKNTPEIGKQDQSVKLYPAGSRILVTLESDAIFVNSEGYTVICDEVRQNIKDALGIKEKYRGDGTLYSEIEVRKLMGYYSKWNLKRLVLPAVRAGSTFEFLLDCDLQLTVNQLYAGERIGEGYGKLRIIENTGEDCCMIEEKVNTSAVKETGYTNEICRNILLKEMKETLKNAALNSEISIRTPSALGRITLMLTESINRYPNDRDKAYEDFCNRIASIKTKDKRDTIENIKNKLICEDKTLTVGALKYLSHIDSLIDTYKKLTGKEQDEQLEKELKNFWSEYFMDVLVGEKYRQKGREEHDEEN